MRLAERKVTGADLERAAELLAAQITNMVSLILATASADDAERAALARASEHLFRCSAVLKMASKPPPPVPPAIKEAA